MIRITDRIVIQDEEISLSFIRASGPGGQNVNKVSTAAQVRFDVTGSPSLPQAVKNRLRRLAGRRLTADGVLVLDARQFRTQQMNRDDAIRRLTALIREAAIPPKRRVRTRPTAGSLQRHRAAKERRSGIKRVRGKPADSAE